MIPLSHGPQVIPALIQPAGLEEIFRRVNFIEGVESYIQVRGGCGAGSGYVDTQETVTHCHIQVHAFLAERQRTQLHTRLATWPFSR